MRPTSVWTIMLALLGTHMAGMGAFLTVPVLATKIAEETGLPAALAGVHVALVYAGTLISGPFMQGLLNRFGGIRMCQWALAMIALGLSLATIGTAWALVLSALVCGFGHAPVTPAGSHLLHARTPPHRRSLIFGLKQCGVPAGAMLVAALAPLAALAFGWRGGVLAMAAFSLLLALLLQPLRAALDADRGSGWPARPLADAARSLALLRDDARIRGLSLMACGYGVSQFCFSSFFVVWQVRVLGLGIAEAGFNLALAQVGGVVGRIGWAMAADRFGPRPVLALLGVGMVGGALLLAGAGPGWPVSLVLGVGVLMGATAIAWNGVLVAEIARVAPVGLVGGATAALGFAFGVTMVVMPSSFSALVGVTGSYAPGFLMCAMASALGLLALLKAPRHP
ncbi:MAG: MFS transporter [Alphaproteobacteria bacterium]|nr:MFS transporter [Alphaproteobacteria bacterium]